MERAIIPRLRSSSSSFLLNSIVERAKSRRDPGGERERKRESEDEREKERKREVDGKETQERWRRRGGLIAPGLAVS